jgi:hypothetical protein
MKKKTDDGREYEVDGKKFRWFPLDDDDEPRTDSPVTIPLRLKLGVLRSLAGRDLDPAAMFDLLEKIIPDQADALDDMDVVLDLQPMFTTWQSEYNALSGASLGESSSSST